jgi:hypothetical protein
MKEDILKHFQEVKATILKRLDEAVADDSSNQDIDELLDSLFEVNIMITNILKSM